jgi:prolyl-tRNA editing enzyme YbaK/EbsC (Cys-tRNA(Pro) deacylase)
MTAAMSVTDRLVKLLTDAGIEYRLMRHEPVRTSEDAARVRGTPLEAGAKALVVRAGDRHVHLVLPAHRRVDNAAVRAILDTRSVRFVTPDELVQLTGCLPGAVPPFGNLFGLPVLVDEQLAARDMIAFNAGDNAVSITMRADDFVRLSGATLGRFTQD